MNSSGILNINNLENLCEIHGPKKISADDPNYKNYTHCSHVMIYARTNSKSLDTFDKVAIILVSKFAIFA